MWKGAWREGIEAEEGEMENKDTNNHHHCVAAARKRLLSHNDERKTNRKAVIKQSHKGFTLLIKS